MEQRRFENNYKFRFVPADQMLLKAKKAVKTEQNTDVFIFALLFLNYYYFKA